MPFGLHSASATLQRVLDQVIGPEMSPHAFAYQDDTIVIGRTERVETWRAEQECRVHKGITELYRTLDSAVNFGPGTRACHMHHGNQRDGSSGQDLG